MSPAWKGAQQILLFLYVWNLCGLCSANNLTEYSSGNGMPRPVAVSNLTISYNETDNILPITWEDSENVNEIDLGYLITYTFTALSIELYRDTITLANVTTTSTSFEYDIPAGIFSEDGVTVMVTVQACNNVGLGESSQVSLMFMGDFIPTPVNFTVIADSSNTSITLLWDNPFDSIQPEQVIITYTGMKLSGAPLTTTENITVNSSDLSAMMNFDSSYTLSNLLFYTEYNVSLMAVYSGSETEAVSDQVTTIEGSSSAVQNLTLTFDSTPLSFNQTTRELNVSVTISWAPPAEPNGNITSYEYTITNSSGSDLFGIVSTSDTSTEFTLIVEPYELYRARVIGSSGGGGVFESSELVRSPETAPSSTSMIEVTTITSTSAIASWIEPEFPNGVILYYEVTLTTNMVSSVTNTSDNSTSMDLTGLEPFTEYSLSVRGVTGGGIGDSGPAAVFTTLEDLPSAVQNLVLNVMENELVVMWDPPAMPNGVVSYNVSLSGVNLVNNMAIEINPSSMNVTDTMATFSHSSLPYSNYTAVVLASTSAGPGPEENVTEQTPEEAPSLTRMIEVANITSTSAIATWTEPEFPNGVILYYEVALTADGFAEATNTSDSSTSMVFAGLEPFTNYTVTVRGVTNGGIGGSGPAAEFTTLEDFPSAVLNLTLNVTEDELIVMWDPPAMPNGTASYNVSLSGVNLVTGLPIEINSNSVIVTDTMATILHTSLPYSTYTAVVFPFTTAGPGLQESVTVQTPEAAPTAVQALTLNVTNSELIVIWDPPAMPNGVVSYNVSLSGVNLVNNMAIEINQSSINVTDTMVSIAHSSLPYSNYTAMVFAATSAGPGPEETVTVQTAEEAPTAVQNLNLTVSESQLFVTWDPPAVPNGQVNYNISLSGVYLATNESIVITPASIETLMLMANVTHSSRPYSEYTVVVFAFTNAGSSAEETVTVQTPEAAPTEVQNLLLDVVNNDLVVMWGPPAMPNGVVSYNVSLSGVNLVDSQPIEIEPSSVIVTDTMYTAENSIISYSNFTAVVFAFTSFGPGPERTDIVQTPEAEPTAVQALTLNVTNDELIVMWDPPAMPNGVVSYNVSLSGVNLVNNEAIEINSNFVSTANTMVSIAHSSLSYSNYTAVVYAYSTAGPGPEETVTEQTPEEPPSAVQSLTAEFVINVPSSYNSTTGLYEGMLNVSWLEPQFPNGVISGYEYTVEGPSPSNTIVTSDTTANTAVLLNVGLLPDMTYVVTVSARTGAGPGESSAVGITVPEATPSPVTNLMIVITNSSTITITWDPPLTPNGALTYTITLTYFDLAVDGALPVTVLNRNNTEDNRTVVYNAAPMDLEPYAWYEVTVVASTSIDQSAPEMDNVTTPQGVSGAPRELMADPTNTTVSVTWLTPEDPNGVLSHYSLTLTDDTSTVVDSQSVTTTELSAMFTDLDPFTNYTVTVRAVTGENGEILGLTAEVQFTTDIGIPTVPQNLMFTNSSATFLNVTWEPPNMVNALSVVYNLQYRLMTGPSELVENLTMTEYDIIGLTPFMEYFVSVQACSVAGCSAFTAEVSRVTGQAAPSPVTNLMIVMTNSSTITITWDPPLTPNGALTYIITLTYFDLAVDGALPVTVLNTNNTEDNRMVVYNSAPMDLEPYAWYEVIVVASTSIDQSAPEMDNVTTPQGVSEAPRELMADPTNTTVSVTWMEPEDPNGVLSHYSLTLTDDTPTVVDSQNVTSSQTNATFDNLEPFANYTVTLRVVTGVDIQGTEATIDFMTETGTPSAPTLTLVNATSSTTIQVEWTAPSDTNGVITAYVVCYYEISVGLISAQSIRVTDGTSIELTGLAVFTEYCVFVKAMTTLVGPPSNNITERTDEGVPGAPEAVMAMELNSTSVRVSWSPPAQINSTGVLEAYTVYYVIDNEGSIRNEQIIQVGPSVQSVVLVNLVEFTSYQVQVSATTGAGEGVRSSIVSVTTDPDSASEPSFVNVTVINSTTIMVEFGYPAIPNGEIQGYIIEYGVPDSGTLMLTDSMPERFNHTLDPVDDMTNQSIVFGGLAPFTYYVFRVAAYSFGEMPFVIHMGVFSPDTDTVRTNEDVPTAPLNFVLEPVPSVSSELSATWELPSAENGDLTAYTVYCTQLPSDDSSVQIMRVVTVNGTVIDGLIPFTEYECYVTANTSVGEGPQSNTDTATTAEDVPNAPPETLVLTALTSTSINATWSPPPLENQRGILTNYTIRYNQSVIMVEPIMLSVLLTGLEKYTVYTVTVSASTGAGEGPQAVMSIRTLSDVPSEPLNLAYMNDSSSSIMLTWDPPADRNGILESYTLQITELPPRTDTPVQNITDISADAMEYLLTDLLPFQTYELVLFALTDRGAGPGSEPLTVYTLEALPTAPLNFNLSSGSDPNELTAVWSPPDPPNGLITAYTVYCNTSQSQAYPQIVAGVVIDPTSVNGDSEMAIIVELTPYTSYDCFVTANTSVGEGAPSASDTARTGEAPPSDAPQNFQVDTIAPTELTFSWSRPSTPNGAITQYTLSFRNETHDASMTIQPAEMVTGYVVLGLNEFTDYTFTLSASTSAGDSPVASLNETTAEDEPSAPPQNLMITFIDSTSLNVTWQPPPLGDQNGVLLTYQITYRETDSTDNPTITDTSDLSVILQDLGIFTEYTVEVRASTSVGLGPEDTGVERTDSTTPAAPQNVATPQNSVTPTSILVTWDPPTPVYGAVTMYSVGYTSSVHNGSMNTTVRILTLAGLMEFTVYTITVHAFTDKGRGDGATVTQQTDQDNPDAPAMFMATTINSTAIRLTWAPPLDPNGIITNYHLDVSIDSEDMYVSETGLEDFNRTIGDGDLREFVLSGLHPYVVYVFMLSASTQAGEGVATMPPRIAFTQQAAPAVPVSNIVATVMSPTSISVFWSPPPATNWNGPITRYTIDFVPVTNCGDRSFLSFASPGTRNLTNFANNADPRSVGASSPANEMLLIDGLEEFVSYVFTVAIATEAGETESTTNDCAMTQPTAPGVAPVITSYTATSNTTAVLEWEELPLIEHNGVISGYIINVTEDRNNTNIMLESTNTTFDLEELVPFTNYTVSVSAVNQEGMGPFSASISQTTFEGVPDPPSSLVLEAINTTSLSATWSPPDEFYGVPSLYFITYTGSKTGSTTPITVSVTSDQTTLVLDAMDGLVGDNTYTVSVQASTSAGRGDPITETVVLPRGASPVVEVTDQTIQIVPIPQVDPSSGEPVPPSPVSLPIAFNIVPEQQVNGPVDRVWIFVQQMPSTNRTIGTYYESSIATRGNWPRYPCLRINVDSISQSRKKRQTESISIQQTIGGAEECGPDDIVCNGPLEPDTEYAVGYRLFSGDTHVDYEFENATYRTDVQPADNSLGTIIAAVVVVVLVVVILIVLIILVIVYIRRRRSGKFEVADHNNNGAQKLIPRDTNGSNVPFLGPSDPNIVPMGESAQTGSTPTKFATLQRSNSRKIHLKDFDAYLKDMLDDSGYKFSEEYERVTEVGLDHAKEASLMAENRAKNRYTNILAYDHSRVKLSFVDDEPGSDYINACYIPGYRMRRAYIATQGPLPATFDDFWRMVWEQNSHIIVMLTQLVERGRTKCHRYWPGTDPSVFGDIAVELVSEHKKEDWTIREFKLSNIERKTRLVRHFQFTSWPDHGVPDTPVAAIDFVKTVRSYVAINHGPVCVHCSAGVGRTGCFIALDSLLQQMRDHDWLDVLGLACEMRQHRNHMIQTEAQYVFIHKAMLGVIEAEIEVNGGLSQPTGFSQSGTYPSLYANHFTEDSTQMTDYYGEDFLSEETHM